MSKPPRQLDARIEIVTPENIAFQYVVAGPFRRLPAFLIDCLIRAALLAIVLVACMLFAVVGVGGIGFGMFLVIWFALAWFYGGLFETLWNGQTPGKRLMGLRVLTLDGQPINAMQAVLRNVLREVDAMPPAVLGLIAAPLYMLGLVTMSLNDRFQRLGDLACGTIVVVEKRSKLRPLASMAQGEIARFAENLPANFVASRSMAQALSIYVARRELFSAPRRFEIARTLAEPLCARWNLPANTNPDLLLCALYHRTFIAERHTGAQRDVPGELVAAEAGAS